MPRRESGMVLPDGVDPNNLPDMKTLKKMIREQKKNAPKDKSISRVVKYVFDNYKAKIIVVIACIILSAIVSAFPSLFLQMLIDNYINPALSGKGSLIDLGLPTFVIMSCAIFALGILSSTVQNVLMAQIGQGSLDAIRKDMFKKMQSLPISYFDTHLSGDIMSTYTNDVDALRQLITQTIPQVINSSIMIIASVFIMVYYSLWLLLVVIVGIFAMLFVTRFVGGNSSRYFMIHQNSLGGVNGYIEESMHGQKVIKVFCHEERSMQEFDLKNEALCAAATNANTFSNILMPIMGNIGNILYVLLAGVGSIIIVTNGVNVGLINLIKPSATFVSVLIGFLTIVKSFTMSVSIVSQQINFFALAKAGARRIFAMSDTQPEIDDGYVELVYAREENGQLTESAEYTGVWAWKHPHKVDGSVTYTKLAGDIEMREVDFSYVPEKKVLEDVTLYAKPGQKVAFVGATGAGKTTIINLLTRFYDIEDGKIRYDGININKIKKADLRRSLGLVLQETNLFTGTIRDNIRYGNPIATDEEVENAARLANAHDFISRLPKGYDTVLESDGANLSQGQRQLLSIARTACKNAPVLILDEATSSIDTRTETLVQRGMDKLMAGRTVFVIAHRLSTVQNSDVIMVLDHGKIIERGTHDSLIEKKGMYYKLYTGAFELD